MNIEIGLVQVQVFEVPYKKPMMIRGERPSIRPRGLELDSKRYCC